MAGLPRLALDGPDELDRPLLPQRKTSADPDVSPGSVGQDLCKARQRNGKMLMDVWRELKIPPHHLIAIEKSCFEALPGRVYAIGFVRSYATWLGLDAETCVARLKAEMAGPEVQLSVIAPSAPPERNNQTEGALHNAGGPEMAVLFPVERRVPQRVIAALMIAVLIYSGYQFVASARHLAPPPVIPVPARLVAEAGLTQQSGAAAVATVGQPVAVSPEPAPVPSTEAAPAQPVSAAAEPAPNFHAPLPLGRRYGMENRNPRVILRVHRSIHVAIQGSRNRIFINRFLGAGDTYRVPNLGGLKLSVPDAGAIEVILDGNTVGFAGKDGSAARGLSLDPPSIINRYHWQQG